MNLAQRILMARMAPQTGSPFKYYRLLATGDSHRKDYGGRLWEAAWLKTFTSSNGAGGEVVPDGIAADHSYPGSHVSNLLDGSTTTFWSAYGTSSPYSWISLSFTDPVPLRSIILHARGGGAHGEFTPSSIMVQGSNNNDSWSDNLGWTDIKEYSTVNNDLLHNFFGLQ